MSMFKSKKKHLRVWRIWRLFPVFHGVSSSHRRRCNPVQAAEKVSSPHFHSTRAESQQQYEKEKALTGIHSGLSTWFYKVTCYKHLPNYTGPPAVQTRNGDGHCRLFQKPCFWEETLILLIWCIRKQGNRSRRECSLMTAPATKDTHALHMHILWVKVFSFDISPVQTWKSYWFFSSSASSAAMKPSGRAKGSLCLPSISSSVMWPWRWNLMCNSLDNAEEKMQNIPAP